MSLDMMAQRTTELFGKCFGHEPKWIVAAPGRVNLIGEHTDYNEGFVLPMAIERYTVLAADRNTDREVTLHSLTTGETATFSVKGPVEPGKPAWSNYVRGVVAGFQKEGNRLSGFDAVIDSSVPFCSGLAGSAALEVATATLLEGIRGLRLDPVAKALLCQRAEHQFAGVPCGIMDQLTAVMAKADHALLVDCRSHQVTPVVMHDPAITVLVVNTQVRYKLAEGEYAKRRAECEAAALKLGVRALRDIQAKTLTEAQRILDPVVFRRARHVVTENERTLQAARAIQAADWGEVGKLMYASHKSLREDYEVTCRELDAVVEIAQELGEKEGMIGCRMTGAGFGGCVVGLVRTEMVRSITRKLDEAYEKRTGTQASIFCSRPAGGARVLR